MPGTSGRISCAASVVGLTRDPCHSNKCSQCSRAMQGGRTAGMATLGGRTTRRLIMTAPRRPFAAFAPPPRLDPAYTAWNTVISYDDYAAAQRAVDRLSDDGFPVEHLDIIGSDLRLVERVTGRLTTTHAAAAGALSGLWAGLLFGILLGLFTSGHSFLAVAATGAALGAGWGAIFASVRHA